MTTKDSFADSYPLPTQQDKEKIQRAILRYEKRYPGRIQYAIEEARREHRADGIGSRKSIYGEVNSQARGRVLFELPEELGSKITDIAPFVFSNKKHLRWFLRSFPELLIPERY